MKKISIALTALTLTVMAAVAPSASAQPAQPSVAKGSVAAAADGYLYAWDGFAASGASCRWQANDADWSTCSGISMRNRASSLQNRGYAGAYEDVDLFYSPSWQGARNCLPNGYYLDNLTGIYFLWDGKAGQGQTMNNNIASHRWSNNC
ncbi:peptidase inhibitor family I36 protein [Streptomyces viridosporus]|uniref:peptidase inhibitor family I36 protein n=1 Tax=Streptomyces viridosporus TaxID=67581 RepID=UPI0009C07C58|nr:hypothetical protein [Streptomyces viridosporus]